MTDKEYWQAIYEAAKARDRDNADIFTENPYKRASDAEQCGYVITASQDFQDDDGKLSKQYIDLWITILTVVPTKF